MLSYTLVHTLYIFVYTGYKFLLVHFTVFTRVNGHPISCSQLISFSHYSYTIHISLSASLSSPLLSLIISAPCLFSCSSFPISFPPPVCLQDQLLIFIFLSWYVLSNFRKNMSVSVSDCLKVFCFHLLLVKLPHCPLYQSNLFSPFFSTFIFQKSESCPYQSFLLTIYPYTPSIYTTSPVFSHVQIHFAAK